MGSASARQQDTVENQEAGATELGRIELRAADGLEHT